MQQRFMKIHSLIINDSKYKPDKYIDWLILMGFWKILFRDLGFWLIIVEIFPDSSLLYENF